MDDSAIICDEVIDEERAKKQRANNEETKTILTNFNEKKANCKNTAFLYFTCIFINYYSIIDSC